jgi:signal transduction histidine kinase
MEAVRVKQVDTTKLRGIARLPLWIGPLDVVLVVSLFLMNVTNTTVLCFHVIFVALTFGAFVWNLRGFIVRSCIWVPIATLEVFEAVVGSRTQWEELIEIPLLSTILVGVFLVARRRAQAQAQLAALLAAEQEHSKRLSELTALKADFTAMVAHELGSPLLAIRVFADMLAAGKLNPAAQTQVVSAIQAEANMLNALLADVQSAASVERADFAVHLRPVSLSVLLADAAAYTKTLAGRHALITTFATDTLVMADPDRISQVIHNLLSNAAKYSPEGAPIDLRARLDTGHVRIEVADAGCGIHPDDLPRIFGKYERGRDCTGRKAAGAGLGLYVSRRIMQAHGSELTATSTLGVGSVFSFALELSQ